MATARLEIAVTLALVLGFLAASCSVSRVYRGSQLRAVPEEHLREGLTTKSEVLRIFGPPSSLSPRRDGDVFVYRYVRRNAEAVEIQEPVITGMDLFEYRRSREKQDLLVIFFDEGGVVREYGFQRGTAELE